MDLTHTEIKALEGNALDAAVAVRVMGWSHHMSRVGSLPMWETRWKGNRFIPRSHWSPSTDLNHCAEMEAALPEEKRGEYLSALEDVIEDAPLLQRTWAIHTAPAPARCRAALMAVMGASE